jgi:hypothetical protein
MLIEYCILIEFEFAVKVFRLPFAVALPDSGALLFIFYFIATAEMNSILRS